MILAIRPDQVRTLARLLVKAYAIDADAWIDAFRHGQAFNIFYQPTFTKIDVMPLQTAHRREEARRAHSGERKREVSPVLAASHVPSFFISSGWFSQAQQ